MALKSIGRNILMLVFLIETFALFGQISSIPEAGFVSISDTLIQKEIASFNLKGENFFGSDTLASNTLIEIPIKVCDKFGHALAINNHSFFKGGIYISIEIKEFDSTQHTLNYSDVDQKLVSIDNRNFWGTNGEIPQFELGSMHIVTHSKFLVEIPDSAFNDLYQQNLCNRSLSEIKEGYSSPYYKVLLSPDQRRLYIYMLAGKQDSMYEVTWVIVNSVYQMRIIDRI